MEEGKTSAALDSSVSKFQSYEDYLSSKVTRLDLYYLEDEEMARQLLELGCIGGGEVLQRKEFEKRKAAAEARLQCKAQQKTLVSAGKDLKDNFLRALAEREEPHRSGKMASIIFIRDRNAHGQEISGYIDYAHRLQTEDFEPYFSGMEKLLPKPTDLSFFNWNTEHIGSRDSPNYHVIDDRPSGLVFKNKIDRKLVDVNQKVYFLRADRPFMRSLQQSRANYMAHLSLYQNEFKRPTGDSSSCSPIKTDLYKQVVIFDHINRRRN